MRFDMFRRLALATLVCALGAPALRADLDLETSLLTSDVSSPVAVVSPEDGTGRLFVVQQTGQIMVWDGAEVLDDEFLDVSTLGDFDQEVLRQNMNFGDEAAVVADLSMVTGPPFSIDPTGGSVPCDTLTPCLAPGESCTVLAELSSASAGAFADSLEVSGNFVTASAALEGVVYDTCNQDGVSVTLTDTDVTGTETFSACEDLTAGSNFSVAATGDATLRAGSFVALDNGVAVAGSLSVQVDSLIALE